MKNQLRQIACLCYLIVSAVEFACSQQIITKPMPFLEQLSSNEINTLYQDKDGFIWIGTSNGLERYDGYDIQVFRNNYHLPELISDNHITCFTENGNSLWVGTHKGVNLIDKKTYQIRLFPDSIVRKSRIRDLLTDRKGNTWIAADHTLYKCNSGQEIISNYDFLYPNSSHGSNISSIYEDHSGNIWVLTWRNGLFKYSKEEDSFIRYPQIGIHNNPYQLLQDNAGKYWLATWEDGLWAFAPNPRNKQPMYHQQDIFNSTLNSRESIFFSLAQDDMHGYIWALSYSELFALQVNRQGNLEKVDVSYLAGRNKMYSKILKDRDGNLWLGAFDKGDILIFEKSKIENHRIDGLKKHIGLETNIIRLNKDKEGIVWFDQERYGICLLNEKTGEITYGYDGNRTSSIETSTILPSRYSNEVWVGTKYTSELLRMKREGMRASITEIIRLGEIISSPGYIRHVEEDDKGNLWIGTDEHLFFKPFHAPARIVTIDITDITGMTRDHDGGIWIGSRDGGIYHMMYNNQPLLIRHYQKELSFLNGDKIESLCTDPKDNICFSTAQGRVISLERKKQKFRDRTEEYNLKGEAILKLLSDRENLWIVCNKSIIQHNFSQNKNFLYSTTDENISVSSFRAGAAFIGRDKQLYAAGHGGFTAIRPMTGSQIQSPLREVFITDVKSNNVSMLFSPTSHNEKNSTQHLTLSPENRNIEIVFSSLKYVSNKKIKYAYKMEGADENWTYLDGGKHSAFYNRLDKGKYTFRVKSTDEYENWNEKETLFTVTMLPAWYETWYAYLLYILLIAALAYWILRTYNRRLHKKNASKFEKELTQAKLNYFTNISHELLTPLTLISCVADKLEQNNGGAGKEVNALRANVSRLKRLLQQILDFRKAESGNMNLHVNHGDISSFVTGIAVYNFQPLAEKKEILFTTEIEKEVWGYADFDKLDKILFNLLSNAIKYTPAHKRIHLQMQTSQKHNQAYLVVKVEDEGTGIAADDLNHIFTKFYHTKNHSSSESNGIGLSLTKEMVTLHHGTIKVESEWQKGSVFTVEIPLDKSSYHKEEIPEAIVPDNPKEEAATEHEAGILIADDNEELLGLMSDLLSRKYRVFTATNGEEALEIIKEKPVDIVISDIMMPKMNGLELCHQIKNDMQTSHIPVIMLTAKNSAEDQIECYKAGAESYIGKPFDMKILQARIDNLIKNRESRQQGFRSNMGINISDLSYQAADEQFLTKAIQCVEKHFEDPEFDIPVLAEELYISKSTLNRKIKAMTGLTPLDFIRNVKLKHACKLLEEKTVKIAEVAYAMGFSSPKYFARCFKEEFGITPTEYQQKMNSK